MIVVNVLHLFFWFFFSIGDLDITRLGQQFSFRFLVSPNTNLQCARSSSRSDDDDDVVNVLHLFVLGFFFFFFHRALQKLLS